MLSEAELRPLVPGGEPPALSHPDRRGLCDAHRPDHGGHVPPGLLARGGDVLLRGRGRTFHDVNY